MMLNAWLTGKEWEANGRDTSDSIIHFCTVLTVVPIISYHYLFGLNLSFRLSRKLGVLNFILKNRQLINVPAELGSKDYPPL
jgi:hypothetical protein